MNVGAISMDRDAAARAYKEYSAGVRGRMLDEYKAIRDGYAELAKGHTLIDIKTALQLAGLDEKNRPKLAIVQAGQKWCYLHRSHSASSGRYSHFRNEQPNQKNGVVNLPPDVWPALTGAWRDDTHKEWMPARFERWLGAVAPIVPPRFLPRDSLSNYFIIFEPVWQKVPSPDPILCKRLNATTFAAVAQWDLTPVELMVLQGRLVQ